MALKLSKDARNFLQNRLKENGFVEKNNIGQNKAVTENSPQKKTTAPYDTRPALPQVKSAVGDVKKFVQNTDIKKDNNTLKSASVPVKDAIGNLTTKTRDMSKDTLVSGSEFAENKRNNDIAKFFDAFENTPKKVGKSLAYLGENILLHLDNAAKGTANIIDTGFNFLHRAELNFFNDLAKEQMKLKGKVSERVTKAIEENEYHIDLNNERIKNSVSDNQEELNKLNLKYNDVPENVRNAFNFVGEAAEMTPNVLLSALNPAMGTAYIAASAYSNSYGEALNDGATTQEASNYALASAALEVALEKLGGNKLFGGKTLTDSLTDKFVKRVAKNKLAQKTIRFIAESSEEGIEEVLSTALQPLIKKFAYSGTYDAPDFDEYVNSFFGGMIGSAVWSGAAAATNKISDLSRKPTTEVHIPAKQNIDIKTPPSTEIAKNGPVKTTDVNSAIERIVNGTATNKDIDLFKPANAQNRAMFEEATGVKLPSTNSEVRHYLRDYAKNQAVGTENVKTDNLTMPDVESVPNVQNNVDMHNVNSAPTLEVQDAQIYNIATSNLIRRARENNLDLQTFYAETENVNAYNLTEQDIQTINNAFVKMFGNNVDENTQGNLNILSKIANKYPINVNSSQQTETMAEGQNERSAASYEDFRETILEKYPYMSEDVIQPINLPLKKQTQNTLERGLTFSERSDIINYKVDNADFILNRNPVSESEAEVLRQSIYADNPEIPFVINQIDNYAKEHNTILINTPERAEYRLEKAKEYYETFGAKNKDRKAVIIIGPPAAGKSTIANQFQRELGAIILDSDIIKEGDAKVGFEGIPEYNNGIGVQAVHEESSIIADNILYNYILNNGDNLVYPKLGSKSESIIKIIDKLKDNGYKITLVLNDLPVEKALDRSVSRYKSTGRLVSPGVILECGYKPVETYNKIKEMGLCDGYEAYSNDVEFGQQPILIEKNINEGRIGKIERNRKKNDTSLGVGRRPGFAEYETSEGSNGTIPERTSGEILNTDENSDYAQRYDALIEQYGAVQKGMQPRIDVKVPKKSSKNQYVSKYARTMAETKVFADAMDGEFEKMVVDGTMSHEVFTNKKAENGANQRINRDGFKESVKEFETLVKAGRVNKEDIAMGQMLLNIACQNKDVELAKKLAVDLSVAATQFGQNVQAFSMLKRMSPDGQLYYLEKSLQKINQEILDNYKGEFKEIEIDAKLAENLLNAKTKEEVNEAVYAIEKNIGEQIPATKMDKWNAWRYLAMLGNTRTHFRNVFGNAVFAPARGIKNVIGAGFEKALPKAERTKSLTKTKESKDFAENDWNLMADVVKGNEGKYGTRRGIEEHRKIFKTKWLEAARKFNTNALEIEDGWFLESAYKSAFAQAMTARGLTAEYLSSGTKQADEDLQKIREHAINEAQKATFRDANEFSDFVSRLRFNGDGKLKKGANMLIEGVLPFKKTPANILMRGVEYSPIGLMKGIADLYQVKKGNMSAAKAIDNISAGLTGTAIVGLGAFLAHLGALVVAPDEDDEVAGYKKMLGAQNYALKIGDNTYTIDWMAPIALPLFVGAEITNTIKNTEQPSLTAIFDALTRISEPVLELSCLSGIQSALESIQYSNGNIVGDLVIDMISSYVTQALPTIGGQVARTIDNTQRNIYYKDKTSGVPQVIQGIINKAMSKVPGLTYFLPEKVDRWGRVQKYGSLPERAFENFVSPGYYSNDKSTFTDKKLMELYEKTGDKSVLPDVAAKSFKVDGDMKYMSADEYVEYSKERGSLSYEYITSFLNELGTNTLDDSLKVEVVNGLYKYANAKAKEKVSDYILDKQYAKVDEAKKAGISPDKYFVAYYCSKGKESDKTASGKTIPNSATRKEFKEIKKNVTGLSEAQKIKLLKIMGYSDNQIKMFKYNLPN